VGDMKPEERASMIAAELARDILQRHKARPVYHFRLKDGDRAVVVSLTSQPQITDVDRAMYIVLGPAGEQCSCCGGSGKQPAQT
jgi:hypothetical protein